MSKWDHMYDKHEPLKRMTGKQAREIVADLKSCPRTFFKIHEKHYLLDYWVVYSVTYATVQAGIVEVSE